MIFFTPIADDQVPDQHRDTVSKYRWLANEHRVELAEPVCYSVRAGFTLRHHAPRLGLCRHGFYELQAERNFPDQPTSESVVFLVPRQLQDSHSKTVNEQKQLLADLRGRLGLPAHHLTGFGQASLLSGLILMARRFGGPDNQLWVRSETFYDRSRLQLSYLDGGGLRCYGWGDEGADGLIGVMPVTIHVSR
jgi:hypothetical protein